MISHHESSACVESARVPSSTILPLVPRTVSDEEPPVVGRTTTSTPSCSPEPSGSMALPNWFEPSPYTVILGRAKEMRHSVGNRRLRVLASAYLKRYSAAMYNKRTKTQIVSELVSVIRNGGGYFVKRTKNDRWIEVKEAVAREKIGYVFRDLLGDKYQSSSKYKTQKRRQRKQMGQEASKSLKRALRATKTTQPLPSSVFSFHPAEFERKEDSSSKNGLAIIPQRTSCCCVRSQHDNLTGDALQRLLNTPFGEDESF